MNLVVSEALITHVTNRGKDRAMLAIDSFRKRHKLVHNGRFQEFGLLLFKYREIDQDTLVTRYSLPYHKISGELKGWDKFWMYWPLWTSLIVAMPDDIENTFVGTDRVITVIYQSIALQTGA